MQDITSTYHDATAEQLSNTRDITRNMVQKGSRNVSFTGMTPTKREWKYPKQWALTQPRDEILREWTGNEINVPPDEPGFPVTTSFQNGEPAVIAYQPLSPSDLCTDLGSKGDITPGSISSRASSLSAGGLSQTVYVHCNTGANGFGRVSKVPENAALKNRPTNILPRGR